MTESTPPAPSNRRLSGRGMSGSPGSSISSLSSVGRIRPLQQPLVNRNDYFVLYNKTKQL